MRKKTKFVKIVRDIFNPAKGFVQGVVLNRLHLHTNLGNVPGYEVVFPETIPHFCVANVPLRIPQYVVTPA